MSARRLLILITIIPAVTVAGCRASEGTESRAGATAAAFTPEGERAAGTISASDLRTWIARISADEFEGRGPAAAGDRAARGYLIEQPVPERADEQWPLSQARAFAGQPPQVCERPL
jgi:hypothetical protein